jgi:NADH dehydrogenase FAD-containing subunit
MTTANDGMTHSEAPQPKVVIVGGGYGGVNAAKALDAYADVVLIEPKDAFVHNVASLRALVEPAFLPSIFLPYDQLLARGRVERDRAIRVGPHRVVVASGKEIAADYVVLATGSTYPFPAKSADDGTEAALARYRAAHDELVPAARVLLIGAGAVGIELAGEIKSKWPEKVVTLLDFADDVLGDQFRPDLRTELRSQLVEMGVELALGTGLRELPKADEAELGEFTVTTDDGRAITADIWFRCFGVVPVSDYLDAELAPARGPDGFVTVGSALQVAGYDNVFAIGDVSTADAKMAGRAGRQAHLVAENIRKLMHGDREVSPYEPLGPAIIVPIGPHGGSGQLPGQDELASREMVSKAKGRDFMVARYAEILGVATADRPHT